MFDKKNSDTKGVYRSLLVACFILFMHVLLIAGIGLLVLFFHGIINYLLWIFLGGSAFIAFWGYMLYKRMQKEGKSLREILSMPALRGRSVEISVLGGLVALKVDSPKNLLLQHTGCEPNRQLDAPEAHYIKELSELVRLLENGLITTDEYNKAKKILFNS